MPNCCFICNTASTSLKNINELDETNEKIITKLQTFLPDVNWPLHTEICSTCITRLHTIFVFRTQCLISYENHLKAPLLACFHCPKTFRTKSTLEEHLMRQHPPLDDDHTCPKCATSFTNKYLLRRHVKNVHATEKKHKCNECGRLFVSAVYLSAHQRYHAGDRRHICAFCGKGYITASDLYHHEKIHANKRAYRCAECSKGFNTSSDLYKHKICVHSDRTLWKHECATCGRKFPLKTNLDHHVRIHTGERNFLCHVCDRKCISNATLKRHLETHSPDKRFKCAICQQSYKYEKSRSVHMTKAHGPAIVEPKMKRFLCAECPKSFHERHRLEKHALAHSGAKPHACPACDKRFRDKAYVRQHLKTAHNAV